jgi:16S rRNA G966 N2-methylase RsmD
MMQEIELQLQNHPSTSQADMQLAQRLLSELKENNSKFDSKKYLRLLLSWKTKSIQRHFISTNGSHALDNISQRWSTGFYRIDSCLDKLEEKIAGKKILDPYAGSGSLEYTLMALDIINDVTLSDISFQGGSPITNIKGEDFFYDPLKNLAEYNMFFTKKFDYFKNIPDPKVFNANVLDKLPFSDNSFDFILGDPPYSVNLGNYNGLQMFTEAQQELLRVSKYGILAFVPNEWINELQRTTNLDVISNGLVHEKTTLKTSLVQISH